MSCFFRRKNKDVLTEPDMQHSSCEGAEPKNNYQSDSAFREQFDDKTLRMIELIGCALNQWTEEYQLENLPKRIVLGQAIDVMHAIELHLDSYTNQF
jgi:hypothetical protein